jgi:hypothetical protein
LAAPSTRVIEELIPSTTSNGHARAARLTVYLARSGQHFARKAQSA